MRLGADPVLGLIPVVGDAIAVLVGTEILLIARQLQVPWKTIAHMAYNQLKNGLIGAFPLIGDVYSFRFKSHAANTALLLRAVKRGDESSCTLASRSLTMLDLAGIAALIVPLISAVGFVSVWFWEHNISYLSIFFPSPYHSESR